MKVGTDGVLIGAWAGLRPGDRQILDIGTGTGLIALMLAQRTEGFGTEDDAAAHPAAPAIRPPLSSGPQPEPDRHSLRTDDTAVPGNRSAACATGAANDTGRAVQAAIPTEQPFPAANGATGRTEESIVDQTADRAPRDTADGTADRTADDAADRTTDRATRGTADRTATQIADGTADRMARDTANKTADRTADTTTNWTGGQTPRDTTDQIADGTADRTTDRAPHDTADETADRTADNAADRTADTPTNWTGGQTPRDTTDQIADGTADRTTDRAPHDTADETADRTADNAADRTADRTADRAIRGVRITGIDIGDVSQARENAAASPWGDRVEFVRCPVQAFRPDRRYDLIISNPPFFVDSLTSPDAGRPTARHAVELPFEALRDAVVRLLTEEGRFAVVLPSDEAARFERICRGTLFASRRTAVRTTPRKAPKRMLLEFVRQDPDHEIPTGELTIGTGAHETYTPEYRALTGDFYLKF